MKSVTSASPQTQNQLLEVVVKHIILSPIVQEIKSAKICSVMADEVTSNNSEQVALGVHLVDADNSIHEEFLGFCKLARITGKHTADETIQCLEKVLFHQQAC